MTWLTEKMLISTRFMHDFMPNLHKDLGRTENLNTYSGETLLIRSPVSSHGFCPLSTVLASMYKAFPFSMLFVLLPLPQRSLVLLPKCENIGSTSDPCNTLILKRESRKLYHKLSLYNWGTIISHIILTEDRTKLWENGWVVQKSLKTPLRIIKMAP